MLSICIPIYNFDVRELVTATLKQMEALRAPTELILIDDASQESYRRTNRPICQQTKYIELDRNLGRAKIRNHFLAIAQYDYLLFLDGDSVITQSDFLKNFILHIADEISVICGGREYPMQRPNRNHFLRWKYGIKRESQPAKQRGLRPNQSFMTNNFLIKKSVFSRIQFDESIVGYGHEDTLFGYQLKKNGIPVLHIHNPIGNGDIESNEVYLQKTEEGIRNLAIIFDSLQHEPSFVSDVHLLRVYKRLKNSRLTGLVALVFWLKGPVIRWMLSKGVFIMPMFDFYKLGLLNRYFSTRIKQPK